MSVDTFMRQSVHISYVCLSLCQNVCYLRRNSEIDMLVLLV